MFGSGKRVPSEGALRVLRQLAYISSGTACGAAALIAEERRRQISLASKIADNSRRLKQHPRYHHSHAAAQRRLEDDGAEDKTEHVDAFRNNLLPSEVEKGYTRLTARHPSHDLLHHPSQQQPIKGPDTQSKLAPSTGPKYNMRHLKNQLVRRGQEKTLAQLEYQCLDYVAQGFPGQARQLFCQCVDSLGLAAASATVASNLFDSLLQAHSLMACRKLLSWMEHKHMSTDSHIHQFVHLCASHATDTYQSSLRYLHQTYRDRTCFPQDVFPALCAAYAIRNPHLSALLFVRHISTSNRSSVLAMCEPAWPAVLDQLWITTRNTRLVDATFDDMCRLASQQNPHLNLHNAWISVLIQSGRIEKAHQHLRTIQQSDYMEPDVVTFGHFVHLTASSSDWPAVDDLMLMLTRVGRDETPPEKRAELFVPVLTEYVKQHESTDVWTFVSKAIDDYGIVPNQHISNIVIQSFARARCLSLIPSWINYMKTQGLDAQITPRIALSLVRQYYFDMRPAHQVMMNLCRRLVNHVPEYKSEDLVILLREAVAYDIRTYRSGLELRRPRAMIMLKMLQDAETKSCSLPRPFLLEEYDLPRVRRQIAQLEDLANPLHSLQSTGPWKRTAEALVRSSQSEVDAQAIFDVNLEDLPSHFSMFQTPVNNTTSMERRITGSSQLSKEQATVLPMTPPAASVTSEQNPEMNGLSPDDDTLLEDLPDTVLPAEALTKLRTESGILIALSTNMYLDAVASYQESLAASGLPRSSYSLEMAIQAQLKAADDGVEEAGETVRSAQDAGLDVTAALMPVLSEHVQRSNVGSRMHVDNLCQTILTFYKQMITSNVPIRHHLATATASVLIKNNKANDAIRLLSTIYHSEWARTAPLDMPAMTVFLQAYIKARHRAGVGWVIKHVLDEGYRIDRAFLLVLRGARKRLRKTSSRDQSVKLSEMLNHYTIVCMERQQEQKKQASRFGNKLVGVMIDMAKAPGEVDAPTSTVSIDETLLSCGLKSSNGLRAKHRYVAVASLPTKRARRTGFRTRM